MSEIATWLDGLGLADYAARFAENDIDLAILPELSDQDLKELGIASLGHRRKLLRAIAELNGGTPKAAATPAAESVAPKTSEAPIQATGERRHLTVMFCDLVGSTEIAGRLDAEEWRDIVDAYHRAVAEAVARFGGYVAKNLGDGALVYFGYPQAQENDAERAVRAGLAILEAIAAQSGALAAGGGPALGVRVGIHAGPVVIGADGELYGEVANIAARVQSAAEPGSLFVTRDVHRMVSGLFVAAERGAQSLKGVAEPVGLFQIMRGSGARRRSRAATPLVGREEELRQIESRWERARAGQGQLVMLVGEAGLGKSRLTEELQSRVADTPHTWTEFTCSQLLQNTPFHPFLEFVRRRLEEQEATPEGRVAALAAWNRAVGLDPAQSVPLIAPLLDLPVPPDYPPPPAAPEERRRRLIANMAGWLTGGARVQAVVLLVEDLHWADPSTLDLIRVLAEQSAAVPLLLLVTARPEFKAPWPHRSHHAVIALAPLEPRDVLRMVEEVAARHALSAVMKEALVARTGGVPLFIEEVTRLLLEGDGQGGTQTIPLTLQASLTARLDRLGAAKEVAQIAAVLGREFPYPLVRAIAGLEDGALTAALDRLAEADVIQAQGMPPEASYRFKHALVQDAAYESLLKTRRRELHRVAAQALAERFKEIAEAQPELLAHHLTEAGDTEAAIKAWRHAAEIALRRPAYVEAIEHYGKAIRLAESLPDGPETRRLRLRLQIAYGQVLIPARGHGALETTAAFARAAELAASIEDTTERFSALYGLWVGSYVRGESGPMRQFSTAFLHDAERAAGSPEIMVGRRIVGCTEWYHGEYAAGAEHLTQALAAYDPERHLALAARYGQDTGVACRCYSALALWPLGDVARALRLAEESIEHARTTGYLPDLPYALTHVCMLESLIGDTDALARHAEELTALSLEHGLPIFLAYGVAFVGCVRWRKGAREEGRAEMARGTRMLEDGGMTLNFPLMRSLAAEVEAERGETAAALTLIDDALAIAERTGQHWQDAELHRGRGEVLLNAAAPDAAGAETSFGRALEIARGQQTRTFELRAALALATLYRASGRVAEIRALLAPIVAGFAAGTALPELAEAARLLA